MIKHRYKYKLYIDDLQSATVRRDKNGDKEMDHEEGIPIGVWDSTDNSVIVFNHLNMTIYTHTTNEGNLRIVGFEVEPMSLGEDENRMEYNKTKSTIQKLEPGVPFRFSYRLRTVVSPSSLFI